MFQDSQGYIENRETQSPKRKKESIHIVWAADGTQVHLQNSNTVFFLSFCTVITHSYYLKNIPIRSGSGSPKHSCTLLTTYLCSNLKSISNYYQRKSHHHPLPFFTLNQTGSPCLSSSAWLLPTVNLPLQTAFPP